MAVTMRIPAADCDALFGTFPGQQREWISRARLITVIFGRVVSSRQRGEDFFHGTLGDMGMDMLVRLVESDAQLNIPA